MKSIISEWIDIDDAMPPNNLSWVIVRCINEDHEAHSFAATFYFMATYHCGAWDYFDDDKKYDETMQVTHWMKEPVVENDHEFIKNINKGET
jgi:Protein of unknown function (DUF551)